MILFKNESKIKFKNAPSDYHLNILYKITAYDIHSTYLVHIPKVLFETLWILSGDYALRKIY